MLVCWLGRESLQKECLGLVRELWAHGISADILYESIENDSVEDTQKFCRNFKIPHIVILGDKALYFERRQVSQEMRTWVGFFTIQFFLGEAADIGE